MYLRDADDARLEQQIHFDAGALAYDVLRLGDAAERQIVLQARKDEIDALHRAFCLLRQQEIERHQLAPRLGDIADPEFADRQGCARRREGNEQDAKSHDHRLWLKERTARAVRARAAS